MRLDAGTLFGHVPRTLYHRWIGVDSTGRIELQNRSFLVEQGERRILLEAGVGTFFSPALRRRFGIEEDHHVLLQSLAQLDLSDADIDWVVLSHLHFDHAGGLLAAHEDAAAPRLLFPRARFLVTRDAWERCRRPHRRDRASFIDALPDLLERSNRLAVVEDAAAAETLLGDRFRFRCSTGHTPGMLHTTVVGEKANLFFCADLIPGRAWIHPPVTMGYDRNAERVVDEKIELFATLDLEHTVFGYTHDPEIAASRITEEDGKFTAADPTTVIAAWDPDRTERPTQS